MNLPLKQLLHNFIQRTLLLQQSTVSQLAAELVAKLAAELAAFGDFFNHSNLAGWLTTHFSVVCQTQNTYLFLLYTDFK